MASDALRCLIVAVGGEAALDCACEGTTTTLPPTTTTTLPPTTTTTLSPTTTTTLPPTTTTTLPPTTTTTMPAGECELAVDGTECSDDGLGCTDDICIDGSCSHPVADPGMVCRAAAYSCDDPEVCDGTSGACPPPANDPLCANGEPCAADEQCASGACLSSTCVVGDGRVHQPCDSDPDCFSGAFATFVCSDGECLADFDTFCIEEGQCADGLLCDFDGSGRCKNAIGAACETDLDCANKASCNPTSNTCLLDVDVGCETNDECDTDFCSCALLANNVCPGEQSCSPVRCVSPGRCKVPFGEACTKNSDCPDTYRLDPPSIEFAMIAEGLCIGDVCTPGKYRIGTVCEVDPPGGLRCNEATTGGLAGEPCTSGADCPGGACQLTPPQRGDSPNDVLCATGSCFKGAGGENGPCTPDDEPCGGPVNPPDYVCCRADNGVCNTDFDCCSVFLDTARGCGSNGRCRPLAGKGDECSTNADCLRRGELECQLNLPCEEEPCGICDVPVTPPVFEAGAECDPEQDGGKGYCGPGLVCLNCEPEGRGYRCADESSPCCQSGGPDESWCGSTVVTADVSYSNLCCDYTCSSPDNDEHCGTCDADCTDVSGEACALAGSGRCEISESVRDSQLFVCKADTDPSLCVDPDPNDGMAVQCISTRDPGGNVGTLCQEYIPYEPCEDCIPWEGFCLDAGPQGRECTADDQCFSCDSACSCLVPDSTVSILTELRMRCECE